MKRKKIASQREKRLCFLKCAASYIKKMGVINIDFISRTDIYGEASSAKEI